MHKAVFAGERRRGGDDEHAECTRALREMIESGSLTKVVTVKSASGTLIAKAINQKGPIAYIDSTTNTEIFDEDANRVLLLGTDESPEQTARIVAAQAKAAEGLRTDHSEIVQKHHAMQRLLKRVEVRIPYAPAIAREIPTHHQNARRAMPLILAMIKAVALLHQQQRSHAVLNHGDIVVATKEDYAIARALLLLPLGRALGGALPTAVARFGEFLKAAYGDSVFSSADAQSVDPSLNSRSKVNEYLRALERAGVAECVESGRGPLPGKWRIIGTAAAGGASWLPTMDKLEGAE